MLTKEEMLTKEDQERITAIIDAIEAELGKQDGTVSRRKLDVAEFVTLTYKEAIVVVELHFLGLGRNALMVNGEYQIKFGKQMKEARTVAEKAYNDPYFFGRIQFDDEQCRIRYRWNLLVPEGADLANFAEGVVECSKSDMTIFLREMARHFTPQHIKDKMADLLGKTVH